MNALGTLRRVIDGLAWVMLSNALVVFCIIFSQTCLRGPDSTRTYAVSFGHGLVCFYTPVVGEYFYWSTIVSCVAVILLLALKLLFPSLER